MKSLWPFWLGLPLCMMRGTDDTGLWVGAFELGPTRSSLCNQIALRPRLPLGELLSKLPSYLRLRREYIDLKKRQY